jgi:hypothetical protein
VGLEVQDYLSMFDLDSESAGKNGADSHGLHVHHDDNFRFPYFGSCLLACKVLVDSGALVGGNALRSPAAEEAAAEGR